MANVRTEPMSAAETTCATRVTASHARGRPARQIVFVTVGIWPREVPLMREPRTRVPGERDAMHVVICLMVDPHFLQHKALPYFDA